MAKCSTQGLTVKHEIVDKRTGKRPKPRDTRRGGR